MGARQGIDAPGTAKEPRKLWVADTLANPASVMPGSQEQTLSALAWWTAGHLDYDVALVILSNWVGQLPLGKPHDPWGPEHVREKLDRAYKKRERGFRVTIEGLDAEAPAALDRRVAKGLRFISYGELAQRCARSANGRGSSRTGSARAASS